MTPGILIWGTITQEICSTEVSSQVQGRSRTVTAAEVVSYDSGRYPISMCFLERDAFVRTNRRAIAMMFVRSSGTGVHCNYTAHV